MQTVRVTFDSGRESSKSYTASVVGTDPSRDLAVLKVDADPAELVPLSVGTSQDLRVGQYVYAIGNPSGLSKTQTSGVVSGLNRSIPSPTGLRIPGAIQTDAAISAGAPSGIRVFVVITVRAERCQCTVPRLHVCSRTQSCNRSSEQAMMPLIASLCLMFVWGVPVLSLY